MKFCLLDANHNGNRIELIGLDEKGNSVLIRDSYEPYMYVSARNKKKLMEKSRMVKKIEEVKRIIGLKKKELLKIYSDEPRNLYKIRDMIKHKDFLEECYEYTIPFYKRYLFDKNFYPFEWLEVEGGTRKEGKYKKVVVAKSIKKIKKEGIPNLATMAIDIEVVDNKIIMISLVARNYKKVLTYKNCKKKYCEVLRSEKELLQRFVKIINEKDPDIIIGYNSDQYDFEVIRERCDENNVNLSIGRDDVDLKSVRRGRWSAQRIGGRIHIDLFSFVSNILSPQLRFESMSLADVSQELLGETKLDMSFEELVSSWKKGNIDKLLEYCKKDSELAIKLYEMLMPQIIELSRVSGQMPFDTSRMTYGLLVESFFIRKATEKGIISPNQPHWNEIQRRRLKQTYEGGYVLEPKLGLHDNIAVFDFRSLYPSIIVSMNISPETLNCSCCKGYKVPGKNYHYCKKKKGFIPQLVKQLIDKRAEIKNRMRPGGQEQQQAIKILANASYGLYGFAGARWYCRECAESAAAYGRYFIKKTMAEAEKEFTVLYGDTDSLMVTTKKNFNKNVNSFLKKINKKLPGILELELQGIYKKGLFVPQKLGQYAAKKRYALIDKEGNVLVRGFEAVRRDWCDLSKELQHNVLRLVLKNKEKEAVEKVKETIEKVRKRKVSLEDLSIRTMLGKPLHEYKATAPHIVVAKRLEKEGYEIRIGTVINYIITTGKGSVSQRAKITEKVKISDYDIDYYIERQILSVSLRVLQVLGYDEQYFLKKGDLKKFMKG